METNNGERKTRWRSEEERQQVVAEYRASKKTQKAFCEEVGIAVPTLGAWLQRSRSKSEGNGQLIEVALQSAPSGGLEIELPNKLRVRVSVGAPVGWVAQIVQALKCGA